MARIPSARTLPFVQNIKSFYQTIMILHASNPIQNIIGTVNLTFGCMSAKNLIQTFRHNNQAGPATTKIATWQMTGIKVIDFCGDLSSILNGIQSRPAIFILNWMINRFLSPSNAARFFGEAALLSSERMNYTIATASFLLGIPSTLKTVYSCYCWMAANRRTFLAKKSGKEECQNRKGAVVAERRKKATKFPVKATDIYTTGRVAMRTVGAASALLPTPRK
ncbi:Conserved hypothetical protein [Candidatus Protochlamydia naegleriophila]|uniref:Uncharacterized protein n=2 Tax=Candidatus Protochlamydia naegleriophila TaxID=389348 RepID=A0A0U5ESA0_9BACT|nr:Conserved hypothetical protein [Candidatus Protochlamydia naegleriophila]